MAKVNNSNTGNKQQKAPPVTRIMVTTTSGKIDLEENVYQVGITAYALQGGNPLIDTVLVINDGSENFELKTNEQGSAVISYETSLEKVSRIINFHVILPGHLVETNVTIKIPSIHNKKNQRINPRFLKPEPCVDKDGNVSIFARVLDNEDMVVEDEIVSLIGGRTTMGKRITAKTDKSGFADFETGIKPLKKGETEIYKLYVTGIEEEAILYIDHPTPKKLTKKEKDHEEKNKVTRNYLILITILVAVFFIAILNKYGLGDMPWSNTTLSPEQISYNNAIQNIYPENMFVAEPSKGTWQWIVVPGMLLLTILLSIITIIYTAVVSQSVALKKGVMSAINWVRKMKGAVARDGVIDRFDEMLTNRDRSSKVDNKKSGKFSSNSPTSTTSSTVNSISAQPINAKSTPGHGWNIVWIIIVELVSELIGNKISKKLKF